MSLTVIDVFADLLRYLYRCTEDYLKQSHASGELLWTSLQKRTHFVLTHPNGWGGPQQNQLKEAAVKAGLVPDMDNGECNCFFRDGRRSESQLLYLQRAFKGGIQGPTTITMRRMFCSYN
jgi:hypothetical protein